MAERGIASKTRNMGSQGGADEAVADLSVTRLIPRLRSGKLTSEALVSACLERIAQRDGDVQAWTHLDGDLALAQARKADDEAARRGWRSALHGIPVGIKDIIDTADMPTQNGCAAYTGRQPDKDASVVATLRAQGAIIMGKTVTTELAGRSPGKTKNPFDPAHTPGGSSSGSAAAVATGMVPLALATQTGGSVIRPASFCGIHAIKPTLGAVSRSGMCLQSHTLDTVGWYARDVADLGLAGDVLTAFDACDGAMAPRATQDWATASQTPLKGPPRLAFMKTPAWSQGDGAMHDAMEAYAARLRKDAAVCEEVAWPSQADAILEHHRTVMAVENAHYYGGLLRERPHDLSTVMREHLEAATRLTAADYMAALEGREQAYRSMLPLFERYDAFLTPASPGPAPEGLQWTGDPIFNGLWTLLGVPCVTLPVFRVGALPMGAQFVGPRFGDVSLLQVAAWVDALEA